MHTGYIMRGVQGWGGGWRGGWRGGGGGVSGGGISDTPPPMQYIHFCRAAVVAVFVAIFAVFTIFVLFGSVLW